MLVAATVAMAGPFSDVPRGHPAYNSLNYLAEKGLLVNAPVEINPTRPLTRYEFAVAVSYALDNLAEQVARAGDTPLLGPVNPEVSRVRDEIQQLLTEFREELVKLDVDLLASRQLLTLLPQRVPHLEPPPATAFPVPAPESPMTSPSPVLSSGVEGAMPSVASSPSLGEGLADGSRRSSSRSPQRKASPSRRASERLLSSPVETFLKPAQSVFSGPVFLPRWGVGRRPAYLSPYTLSVGLPAYLVSNPRWETYLGKTKVQFIAGRGTLSGVDEAPQKPVELFGRGVRTTWGHLGLNYLWVKALNPEQLPAGTFAAGEVYGADMRLAWGDLSVYLEYARSEVEDKRGQPLLGGEGIAFEAGTSISRPLFNGQVTAMAAYRRVDPAFLGPLGFGGLQGFWGWLSYRRPNLSILSSYEHYFPVEAQPFETIGRTLANLEYGSDEDLRLSLGYELIRRRQEANLEVWERYITAGLSYGLSDNVWLRINYRYSDSDNSPRRWKDEGSIAVSEVSIRF